MGSNPYKVSETVCPVKLDYRLKSPGRHFSPYHKWGWDINGKDGSGATLKRGICKLCGFALEIERFCARCGVILPDEEPGKLCVECIEEAWQ